MGKLSTGAIIGIVAGGGVLLYFLMNSKPATPALPPATVPAGVSPATAAIQAQASTTNTEVTQGANVVNNLISSIFS